MKKYDVIVIGAGGGSKIITPASKLGCKVAVIEKEDLGGTCLNRGCIPSKMLIYPADCLETIRQLSKFDINIAAQPNVNFEALVSRITQTITKESRGIEEAYHKNPHIDVYHDHARFLSNKVISVNGKEMTADKIFIAVGSRPHIPFIDGLEETPYMTSRIALRSTELPRKMLVIGGGYIAVELGCAYQSFGSQVEFILRSEFLRKEDKDIKKEFDKVFSQHHVVHRKVKPTRVHYHNGTFYVTITDTEGSSKELCADALLVATGVIPNTDDLGLEHTDVQIKNRFIQVNDRLQTHVKDVYALGDCIGRFLFRHSVNFEGEYLMRVLFKEQSLEPICYPPMPYAVFSYPQIAKIGKTEEECQNAGLDYVIGLNHYGQSAMGMARLSDHGLVKILVERNSGKLLGAHIIGDEASDMIHIFIAMLTMDGTLDDLLRMIYIHPALPEIARNAARKAREAMDLS